MNEPLSHTAGPEDREFLAELWAQLGARLAALLAAREKRSVVDPALKGLVITESEVSDLLSDSAEKGVEFPLGSLWAATAERVADPQALRFARLSAGFQLSSFETEAIAVCLAPEADRRFERVYGYLNDGITQRYPTADLLLRLLAPASVRAQLQALFAPDARLLRYGLLVAQSDAGGAHPTYRVSDGIVRFLLEQGGIDALLARAWCPVGHSRLAEELWSKRPELAELTELLHRHRESELTRHTPLAVVLQGRPGSGRRFVAESACRALGLGCISLDAQSLKRGADLERTLTAAFRDSTLAGAPVLLDNLDALYEDAERFDELRGLVEKLLGELGWALFITTQDGAPLARWCARLRVVELAFAEPTITARAQAWVSLLERCTPLTEAGRQEVAQTLAGRFRLSFGEMAETMFRASGAREQATAVAGWIKSLLRHAAQVAAPRLKSLAQQISPRQQFDELVLTPDKKESLFDIVRRARFQRTVMEDWGFGRVSPRGRGLVALFFGPSGTGKTMAAEVIAAELGVDLYRVDLSGVVSKYIGETEKNLRAVFDEADRSDALLFFDEADALFGKRSEVRDAHDRYANIEVNYLLQRIENFSGVAILATNMRQQLDEAFLRRIHVSVEFPMPRAIERLRIWEQSFPQAAPLSPTLDLRFFADRFEIAGGSIRNIALGAAFLAAETGVQIGMDHLVAAAQREFIKSGRRVLPREFAPHAAPLPGRSN